MTARPLWSRLEYENIFGNIGLPYNMQAIQIPTGNRSEYALVVRCDPKVFSKGFTQRQHMSAPASDGCPGTGAVEGHVGTANRFPSCNVISIHSRQPRRSAQREGVFLHSICGQAGESSP